MSHATHKPDDDLNARALKLMDKAAKRREEYLKRFEPPLELKIVEAYSSSHTATPTESLGVAPANARRRLKTPF